MKEIWSGGLQLIVDGQFQADGVEGGCRDPALAQDFGKGVEVAPDAGVGVDASLEFPVKDGQVVVCGVFAHRRRFCLVKG